ncbi:phosphoglucosamine mutase [Gordoniibacillus kamchatkensis]|uniref:Phosphoglucosamine mutase n=1 Tax=Gordoniibacillus kamchatkensis TaxID=1590651 RepID=A0ABR5ALQ6_9BACL|nr:phosphoglucosamine mutase [Paenibacillus sp. VKM B-2647]KIL41900.1 phosphoglucosamine mutase [Paenibacillus sp. VKM B-2647]
MGRYFGTDGVRGVANQELTPELAYRLGRAGAYLLTAGKARASVVVGKDTRISGDLLESALIAGILSVGADAIRAGVIPTPGVAYLTRTLAADAGVMISASHNPAADNGIKFFGSDGFKLVDEMEQQIEALLDHTDDAIPRPVGAEVGRVLERQDACGMYVNYLAGTTRERLDGMKIVMDCANGAAAAIAPEVLRALGANVIPLAAAPNGVNINVNCGSTHPSALQDAVVREGAQLGLAFDGDADRLIAVDETGELVDGDYIAAILARSLLAAGKLDHRTVVTTVMSNMGFVKAMKLLNINVVQTAVGDRNVMEAMRQGGYVLGGEQSGHMIMLHHNTTGDGILTAVQLASVMANTGQPLGELRSIMRSYPQLLVNVPVAGKQGWDSNIGIRRAIEDVRANLGDEGRVLVRPSGTEPFIRVMVEGPDAALLEKYAQRIADVIRSEMGVLNDDVASVS